MPPKVRIAWLLNVTKDEQKFFDTLFEVAEVIKLANSKEEYRVPIPRNEQEEIDFTPWAKSPELSSIFLDVYQRLLSANLIGVVKDEAPNGSVPHRLIGYDQWEFVTVKERPKRWILPGLFKAVRKFQATAKRKPIVGIAKWLKENDICENYGILAETFRTTITQPAEKNLLGIYPIAKEVKTGNVWVVIPGFEKMELVVNRTVNGNPTDPKKARELEARRAKRQAKKEAFAKITKKRAKKTVSKPETSSTQPDITQQLVDLRTEITTLEQEISVQQLKLKELRRDEASLAVKAKTALRERLATLEAERKEIQAALRD